LDDATRVHYLKGGFFKAGKFSLKMKKEHGDELARQNQEAKRQSALQKMHSQAYSHGAMPFPNAGNEHSQNVPPHHQTTTRPLRPVLPSPVASNNQPTSNSARAAAAQAAAIALAQHHHIHLQHYHQLHQLHQQHQHENPALMHLGEAHPSEHHLEEEEEEEEEGEEEEGGEEEEELENPQLVHQKMDMEGSEMDQQHEQEEQEGEEEELQQNYRSYATSIASIRSPTNNALNNNHLNLNNNSNMASGLSSANMQISYPIASASTLQSRQQSQRIQELTAQTQRYATRSTSSTTAKANKPVESQQEFADAELSSKYLTEEHGGESEKQNHNHHHHQTHQHQQVDEMEDINRQEGTTGQQYWNEYSGDL